VRGELLVSVSSGSLGAQYREAQAALEREELELVQLTQGSSRSGSAIAIDLENARRDLSSYLRNGYANVDSAVAVYIDQLYDNARTSPDFGARFEQGGITYVLDPATEEGILLDDLRDQLNDEMQRWQGELGALDDEELFAGVDAAEDALGTLDELIHNITRLLDRRSAQNESARTLYNTLKSNMASTQTAGTSARSNISASEQALRAAQSIISEDAVTLQRIAVDEARARLAGIGAELAEATIRAPISGTIVRQDAKIGEFISASTPVTTLASDAMYEIEVFIPEADIAKVSIGDQAFVTLDAFGDDAEFTATVSTIDPAETLVEGVATFKATLHFSDENNLTDVRPGMTANIDIQTGSEENVIAIPQRALVERDNEVFVRVIRGEDIVEVPVQTGLRGSDGTIEIIEGLAEGEEIVVFIEEE
jgi:RND family efflux transporter MFP subunit